MAKKTVSGIVFHRSMIRLATPGFPCVTSPRPLTAGCWVFTAWVFALL